MKTEAVMASSTSESGSKKKLANSRKKSEVRKKSLSMKRTMSIDRGITPLTSKKHQWSDDEYCSDVEGELYKKQGVEKDCQKTAEIEMDYEEHSGADSDERGLSSDDRDVSLADSALARLTSPDVIEDTDTDRQEEDVVAKIRKELSDRPFSEIQKLKDQIGTKAYNKMFGVHAVEPRGKKVFKRANRHRPMEVSSKTKVPYTRQVVKSDKKVHRDPRFDDLSGEYNETFFNTAYSFLDDIKLHEKQKIVKELSKTKDEEKKGELKHLLRKLNNKDRLKEKEVKQHRLSAEHRKREMNSVQHGKQPFYLKQSEKKKLELAEKYRELKKSGKVEAYLSKKRKKTASKDRKKLPIAGIAP